MQMLPQNVEDVLVMLDSELTVAGGPSTNSGNGSPGFFIDRGFAPTVEATHQSENHRRQGGNQKEPAAPQKPGSGSRMGRGLSREVTFDGTV